MHGETLSCILSGRVTHPSNKKEGEAVVELDQFKSILATYTEPLVEVRDSL